VAPIVLTKEQTLWRTELLSRGISETGPTHNVQEQQASVVGITTMKITTTIIGEEPSKVKVWPSAEIDDQKQLILLYLYI